MPAVIVTFYIAEHALYELTTEYYLEIEIDWYDVFINIAMNS